MPLRLVIRRRDFAAVFDKVPDMARTLMATLSRRVRQAERALRKDPGSALYHHEKGLALRRLGNIEGARESFGKAAAGVRMKGARAGGPSTTADTALRPGSVLAVVWIRASMRPYCWDQA